MKTCTNIVSFYKYTQKQILRFVKNAGSSSMIPLLFTDEDICDFANICSLIDGCQIRESTFDSIYEMMMETKEGRRRFSERIILKNYSADDHKGHADVYYGEKFIERISFTCAEHDVLIDSYMSDFVFVFQEEISEFLSLQNIEMAIRSK